MAEMDKNEKWTGVTAKSDPNQLPQAGNDTINVSEDAKTGTGGTSAHVIQLSTLFANDRGGEAKTLYGADTVSQKGADVVVSADGLSITYNTLGKFDHLKAGETATDTFAYTIRLANGALSTATITVNVVGTGDAPVVTGVVTGAATEDGAAVTLNALANASDADAGTILSVVNVPAAGDLPAGVTYDAATKAFTLDPSHAAYQSLAAGAKMTVTVEYGVSDGTATTLASVSWEITGTDDGPPTYFEKTTYATGDRPEDIALADLNGDGNQDIIAANLFSNTVSVLLGNSDGTLEPQVQYAAGYTSEVAVGDVNGDGKLDLVASAYLGTSTVSVLLGNGDGTFQAATQSDAGGVPVNVALGDVNNDGKQDVIATNYTSNTISVLAGNSDGTFQTPSQISVSGFSAWDVALSDLNGDGNQDIVATLVNSDSVSVFLGKGDGTFQPEAQYKMGSTVASELALGDLDGDGDQDLVTENWNDAKVSVLLNNGDGTFQTAVQYEVGQNPLMGELGDMNGDGNLDIVAANYSSDSVSVLLGNGDGTFQPQFQFDVGGGPHDASLGDLDGDGRLDIVTADTDTNTVSVLLGATPDWPLSI